MRSEAADVEWRLCNPAVGADLAAGQVTPEHGPPIGFDALIVCTGLRPRRLRLPGPNAGRFVLRTLDDAVALHAVLHPGVEVVVVGAGFIGCEVAATARTLGCEVTVLAPESEPMERALGVELGAQVRRRHEAHGVRWRLRETLTGFTGTDTARGVWLPDGAALPAEVVVEAVGSTPNLDWLAGNGLDLSDGLLCDNVLRAVGGPPGAPPVVAVGDVARFPNPLFGPEPARIEHWSVPGETARRAARTVAGALGAAEPDDTPFTPVPTFWSDQYDFRVQSVGRPDLGLADVRPLAAERDGTQGEEPAGEQAGDVVLGYHRGGRLVGVAGLVGRTRAVAVLRHRALLARP
jgi:NADPH-dependent 2,4-dienoyl-CoA reductase/sulfur reductase-like enzyme